jgi:hypothetical protein
MFWICTGLVIAVAVVGWLVCRGVVRRADLKRTEAEAVRRFLLRHRRDLILYGRTFE